MGRRGVEVASNPVRVPGVCADMLTDMVHGRSLDGRRVRVHKSNGKAALAPEKNDGARLWSEPWNHVAACNPVQVPDDRGSHSERRGHLCARCARAGVPTTDVVHGTNQDGWRVRVRESDGKAAFVTENSAPENIDRAL